MGWRIVSRGLPGWSHTESFDLTDEEMGVPDQVRVDPNRPERLWALGSLDLPFFPRRTHQDEDRCEDDEGGEFHFGIWISGRP